MYSKNKSWKQNQYKKKGEKCCGDMGEVGATSWALSRRNSLPSHCPSPAHLLISVQPHPGFEPNGKIGLSSALFDNFPKPRHVFHNKVNGQSLSRQMVDLTFEPISPKRFNDVITHLRYSFFVDEPLNKSLSISKPGQPHAELEEFSINILTQGMSFMGIDTKNGKVVGVALNGIDDGSPPKKDYKDPKMKKIFDFLLSMDKDVEVLKKYNRKDILELKILSVDSTYRRRGIAQSLYKVTEKFARSKNFLLIRTDTTALYSQKVFLNFGFKSVKEVFYDEYPSRESPMFNVEPPNLSYKLLIKDISSK